MISVAIEISLIITAVYVLFMQGMLLGWFRILTANLFDWLFGLKWSTIIQKPIWGCLPCMASLWTILLTYSFNLELMLVVCGINILIDNTFLNDAEIPGR